MIENDTTWVREILHPGENLLWTGKPGKGLLLRKDDLLHGVFSLAGIVFAVFWIKTVQKSGVPTFFVIFGILVVLIGFGSSVGMIVYNLIRRKRAKYALTSERVILKYGKTRKSLELISLPRMTVTRRSNGTGNIRFGVNQVYHDSTERYNFFRPSNRDSMMDLWNIPDVDRVEYRIRTAREQAERARYASVTDAE